MVAGLELGSLQLRRRGGAAALNINLVWRGSATYFGNMSVSVHNLGRIHNVSGSIKPRAKVRGEGHVRGVIKFRFCGLRCGIY